MLSDPVDVQQMQGEVSRNAAYIWQRGEGVLLLPLQSSIGDKSVSYNIVHLAIADALTADTALEWLVERGRRGQSC